MKPQSISRRNLLLGTSGFAFAVASGCGSSRQSTRAEDMRAYEFVPEGIISPDEDHPDFGIGRKYVPKGIRGIQPVLLHLWSPEQASRMADGLLTSSNSTVEIGFAPFFGPAGDGRFKRISEVVDKLLLSNFNVNVNIHFSFHNGSSLSNRDSIYSESYKNRLSVFYTEFFNTYFGNEKLNFRICPSLEDDWDDTDIDKKTKKKYSKVFNDYTSLLITELVKIHEPIVPLSDAKWDKVQLLRCRGTGGLAIPSNVPVTSSDKVTTRNFGVIREIHGGVTSKYEIYCNDGNFVWDEDTETKDSKKNADENSKEQYSMKSFLSGSDSVKGSVLLWRPSYNLLGSKSDKKAKILYFAPEDYVAGYEPGKHNIHDRISKRTETVKVGNPAVDVLRPKYNAFSEKEKGLLTRLVKAIP